MTVQSLSSVPSGRAESSLLPEANSTADAPDGAVSSRSHRKSGGRGPRGRAILAQQLFEAARYGNLMEAQACLKAGADMNELDNDGWTALHYAVSGGHVEVCEALIKFGADLEVQLPDLSTPLMLAADEGNLLLARLLLRHGALPGWRDDGGFSAQDRCDPAVRAEFVQCILECQ